MPIQFACTACRQLLSVGTRKAQSTVKCPRCGASLVVPTPEQAAVALAMSKAARPAKPEAVKLSDLAVFDEAPPVPAGLGGVRAPGAPAEATIVDKQLVSFPRYVLYAQGALLAVVLFAAFVMGFFSGRGARVDLNDAPGPRVPVTVGGSVVYGSDRKQQADVGAVVVALPGAAVPLKKFPIAGLSPRDPVPVAGNKSVEAIELGGGAYVRADEKGKFNLTVAPGTYQVLVISAHANRPLGAEPELPDLERLRRWFESALDLIGPARYVLAEHRLPGDGPLRFELRSGGQ